MPNPPVVRSATDGRQPSRNFRAGDDLWDRALAATKEDKTTISAVLVTALEAYCNDHDQRRAVTRLAELEARLHRLEHPPRQRRAAAAKPPTPKD